MNMNQEIYTLDYQEYEYQEQREALANQMDVEERYAWVDERLEQLCEEHCESASKRIYDLDEIMADIRMDVIGEDEDEDTDDVIVLNKNKQYVILNQKMDIDDYYYDYVSSCEDEDEVIPMDIDDEINDESSLLVCRKLFQDDEYDDDFERASDLLSELSDVDIYPLTEDDKMMLSISTSPKMVRSNTIVMVLEDGSNVYNGNPNGSRFYDEDDAMEVIT